MRNAAPADSEALLERETDALTDQPAKLRALLFTLPLSPDTLGPNHRTKETP